MGGAKDKWGLTRREFLKAVSVSAVLTVLAPVAKSVERGVKLYSHFLVPRESAEWYGMLSPIGVV